MQNKIRQLLNSLGKLRTKYWCVTPESGQFLNLLIRARKPKNVLEIGTGIGYSGIWMAEALSHHGGHLYTIESHKKERYHLAARNFKKSGLSKFTTLILGHAPEAIPKTPRTFDMAFFDATKYEHISYFQAIENHIAPSGIIITDNIDTHRSGLLDYLKILQNSAGWTSTELDLGTGLLVSIKSPKTGQDRRFVSRGIRITGIPNQTTCS